MKVRCIENSRDSLPTAALKKHLSSEKFSLLVGKEYIVYALSEFYGYVWYCIFDEHHSVYPMWNPSMLFEISDPRLSRYWIYSFRKNPGEEVVVPFISFPEWVNDYYFYGHLVDGDSDHKASIIINKYRKLMEVEFPDHSIAEKAQIGDDQWLICPQCIDAWESSDVTNAMVICPKCKKMYHNPRYKDELPHF